MDSVDILNGDDSNDRSTIDKLVGDVNTHKPSVIFFAPSCAQFSQLQRFNTDRRLVTFTRWSALEIPRKIKPVLEAVARYGGHVTIEHPKNSTMSMTKEFKAIADIFQ